MTPETEFPVQIIGGVPVVVAPEDIDITNAERLRAARVPVEHRHFGSQIHGFFTFVNLLDDADRAVADAGQAIRAAVDAAVSASASGADSGAVSPAASAAGE